jgi:hypothetical protein
MSLSPHWKLICLMYSFQKMPQFSQRNPVLNSHASKTNGYNSKFLFFNLDKKSSLEKTEPISTIKHLSCWKYSFQKLTQFSVGN